MTRFAQPLAISGGDADMLLMTHFRMIGFFALALALVVPVPTAFAQDMLSPPQILPPPPPAPPPPRIEVPRVPQMGDVPSTPKAALQRRKSFDKRVTDCIHEGAGLGPNERAAYQGRAQTGSCHCELGQIAASLPMAKQSSLVVASGLLRRFRLLKTKTLASSQ